MEPNRLLEEWAASYGDELLRMCFLYLKDYHLAEDAVQETFLKAAQSYSAFRQESSAKTWLTRIAINCCKNIMRTRWFKSCRNSLEEETAPDAPACLEAEQLLERSVVSGAISRLSPKDRELILLYYYQELDAREIASILGKKENTILKRLSRARARLKEQLQKEGYQSYV